MVPDGGVRVTARSADGVIVVVALAELFEGFASVSVPETLTVLAIDAPLAPVVVTTIVSVTGGALAARLPIGSVITPLTGERVWPRLSVAETNVTFAGRVSVSVTPVAGDGPAFVSVAVYVTFWPTA